MIPYQPQLVRPSWDTTENCFVIFHARSAMSQKFPLLYDSYDDDHNSDHGDNDDHYIFYWMVK